MIRLPSVQISPSLVRRARWSAPEATFTTASPFLVGSSTLTGVFSSWPQVSSPMGPLLSLKVPHTQTWPEREKHRVQLSSIRESPVSTYLSL